MNGTQTIKLMAPLFIVVSSVSVNAHPFKPDQKTEKTAPIFESMSIWDPFPETEPGDDDGDDGIGGGGDDDDDGRTYDYGSSDQDSPTTPALKAPKDFN